MLNAINRHLTFLIKSAKTFAASCFVFTFANLALANPVLDGISAGNVVIQQRPGSTVIQQTSQQAILNWQNFNIGSGESVHFQQAANGVALNRINAAQGASQIYGSLTATGQIILINPAGIYFGPIAYVNVNGLIATTANLSDDDFLKGHYKFLNAGSGAIVNQGQLIAADNGLIALLASGVSNEGLIQANLGKVVLASGEAFTLNFQGNELIHFSIDQNTSRAAKDKNGYNLTTGVNHSGHISANGGSVFISAKSAANVLDHMINMTGVVEAKTVLSHKGQIILSGHEGAVRVSGKLNASSHSNNTGGEVTVTGKYILLDDHAQIDVSGNKGGGNIFIGGNYQGKGLLPHANATVIAPAAMLSADAMQNGNGGQVIVWADDSTKVYGAISAKGGAIAGHGGLIETSGKAYLEVAGIRIDTSAPMGINGTWLLDPYDVTISSATTANGSFNGSNPNVFTPNATGSIVNVTDLQNNLASANVQITTNGGGADAGNITLSNAVTWASTNTLSLIAANNIVINAGVTAANGGLILQPGGANSSITFGASGNINVANTTVAAGTLNVSATTALGANTNLTIANGASLGISFSSGTLSNTRNINLSGTGVNDTGAIIFSGNSATISNNITLTGNTSFGGINTNTLSGIVSGAYNFTKVGTGILSLSGASANTYSGTTYVNTGQLRLNKAGGLGNTLETIITGSASLNVGSSGTLANTNNITLSATSGTPLTISGAATLNNNIILTNNATISTTSTGTIAGVISGNYGLTFSGSGNLTLSNSNTFTGPVTVGATTLNLSNASAIANATALTLQATSQMNLNFNNATLVAPTVISIASTGPSFNGGLNLNGSNIVLNSDLSMTANTAIAGTGTGQINGVISGAFVLYKYGTGKITLNGTNTYSGATNILGGTLAYANPNAIGQSTAISLGNNIEFSFNNETFSNAVTISTQNGAGFIFSGTNNTIASNIATNGTTTFNTAQDVTLTGNITGSGSYTKTGTSTLNLSGSVTATSSLNINAGMVKVNTASSIPRNNISIANGATLELAFSNATFGNNFAMTVRGSGISNQGAIIFSGNNIVLPNALTLAADTTLSTTGSATINNVISGAFNLTKAGSGTLNLTGSNTYSGSTNVNAGTLGINAVGALGSTSGTTVNDNASLSFAIAAGTLTNTNPITITGTDAAHPGAIIIAGTSTTSTLNNNIILTSDGAIGGTNSANLNGIISGAGKLIKTNNAMINLNGINTYAGVTDIQAGTLVLKTTNALGSSTETNVASGAVLRLDYGSGALGNTNPIKLSGTGLGNTGALIYVGTDGILTNDIQLVANSSIANLGHFTLNGNITGAYNLTKLSSGTLTLTGNNTYSGSTLISAGTLELAAANAATNTSAITLSGNTNLTVSFSNATLSGSGQITLGNSGLTLSGNNIAINNPIALTAATTVSTAGNANLTGVLSGAFNFIKSGTGKLTLNGNNTYSGTTSINNGILSITNKNALGSTSAINIATNAALDINIANDTLTNTQAITVNGSGMSNGGAITFSASNTTLNNNITMASDTLISNTGNATLNGVISGAFNLTKDGVGKLILNGNNTYSGSTSILHGTLTFANVNAIANSTAIAVNSNIEFAFSNSTFNSGATITAQDGAGFIFSGANTIIANNININGVTNFDASQNATLSGVISGTGTVNKAGTGTLTLSGTETSSAPLNINAGTIKFNNANSTLGNTISIADGAALELAFSNATLSATTTARGSGINNLGPIIFSGSNITLNNALVLEANTTLNTANTATLSGTVSGAYNLIKIGTGTLNLTGNNSYGGSTTISAGTLGINAVGALGNSTAITVNDHAAISFAIGNNTLTNTSTITFSGSDATNPGQFILAGSGTTSTFNNNIILANNGLIGGTNEGIINGVISGSGKLIKTGNAVINLNGTNTYSGNTDIQVGTLVLKTMNALGNTAETTVANGASLQLDFGDGSMSNTNTIKLAGTGISNGGALVYVGAEGTLANNIQLMANSSIAHAGHLTLNGNISGAYNLTKLSNGTLTLAGNNTYSGSSSINGGTLEVASANAIANTSAINLTGNSALKLSFSHAILNGTGQITLGNNGLLISGNEIEINNPIALTADSTINATGNIRLNGAISGAYNLTKIGAGEVNLAASNAFTGTTTVNAGTLRLSHVEALGGIATHSSALYINNSANLIVDNIELTASLPINVNTNGSIQGIGTAGLSGSLTLLHALQINTTSLSDNLILNTTINGGFDLATLGNGKVSFLQTLGGTQKLSSIDTQTQITIGANISTTGSQLYQAPVTLIGHATLVSDTSVTMNNSAAGTFNLNVSAPAITLNSDLAINNLSLVGTSSDNTLTLETNALQTWVVNAANAGIVMNLSNMTGTTSFSNFQHLVGGNQGNEFKFENAGAISGEVNAGNNLALNKLDFFQYQQNINLNLNDLISGSVTSNGSPIVNYSNISAFNANATTINTLTLPSSTTNTLIILTAVTGNLNNNVNFSNFKNFVSQNIADSVIFNIPAILDRTNHTATINGITLSFNNISFPPLPPPPVPEPIPNNYVSSATINVVAILQQPALNTPNLNSGSNNSHELLPLLKNSTQGRFSLLLSPAQRRVQQNLNDILHDLKSWASGYFYSSRPQ